MDGSPSWAQGLGSLAGRSLLASTTVVFAVVAAPRSTFALWFVAVSGALGVLAGATKRLSHLRALRLVSGGTAATTGAVLTMQLSFMDEQPQNEPAAFVAAMLLVALALAAAGTWVSDWRISAALDADQQRRDAVAAERHAEVVRLLLPHPTPAPRLRVRDLALLVVAARLLRR